MKVKVEALDFDWLFEHNNAHKFLKLLIHQERSTLFG